MVGAVAVQNQFKLNYSNSELRKIASMSYEKLNQHESSQIIADISAVFFENKTYIMTYVSNFSTTIEGIMNQGNTGSVVAVRKESRFSVVAGLELQDSDLQPLSDAYINVSLQNPLNVFWQEGKIDGTINIFNIISQYVEPSISDLAQTVESRIFEDSYYKIFNIAGTPGEKITPASVSNAGAILNSSAIRDTIADRVMFYNPYTYSDLVVANATVYDPISRSAYTKDKISPDENYFGFMAAKSSLLPVHTNGTWLTATSISINGPGQESDWEAVKNGWSQILALKGFTINEDEVIRQGDIFEITGVYAVNPITKTIITNQLQRFTALEDANSDGSGNVSVLISPYIVVADGDPTNDARANVSNAPGDDSVVYLVSGDADSTYTQSIGWSKQAIMVVSVHGADTKAGWKGSSMSRSGFKIDHYSAFAINTPSDKHRFMCTFGHEVINPYAAVRIIGEKIATASVSRSAKIRRSRGNKYVMDLERRLEKLEMAKVVKEVTLSESDKLEKIIDKKPTRHLVS